MTLHAEAFQQARKAINLFVEDELAPSWRRARRPVLLPAGLECRLRWRHGRGVGCLGSPPVLLSLDLYHGRLLLSCKVVFCYLGLPARQNWRQADVGMGRSNIQGAGLEKPRIRREVAFSENW